MGDTAVDGGGRAGLVLEVAGRRAVVLCQGRFLRVRAATGWQVGEEVVLPPTAGAARGLRWRVAGAATLGAAVVLGGSALWAGLAAAQPVAVVSLDVDPSVQMAINASGRVVSVRATDAGGAVLLAGGGLRGKPLGQAMETLLHRASAAGYLAAAPSAASSVTPASNSAPTSSSRSSASAPTSSSAGAAPSSSAAGRGLAGPAAAILLTVAPTAQHGGVLPPEVAAAVAAGEAAARAADSGVPVAVAQLPGGVAGQAAAAGLSIGQYVLWQAAAGAGVDLPASAARQVSLRRFLDDAGVPPQDDAVVEAAAAAGPPDLAARVFAAARQGARPEALRAMLAGSAPQGSGGSGPAPGPQGSQGKAGGGKGGGEKKGGQGKDGGGGIPPSPGLNGGTIPGGTLLPPAGGAGPAGSDPPAPGAGSRPGKEPKRDGDAPGKRG